MIQIPNRIARILAGLSLLLGVPAVFADSGGEAATAAQHAGFAAKSPQIQQVHMHLHHAVNCLVGPGGDGFDPKQANPCAGQGNGAIPDATDPVMKERLESAMHMAKSGLASEDMATATRAATLVRQILEPGME
jgi:hypothetical protein